MRYYLVLTILACGFIGCITAYDPPLCFQGDTGIGCTELIDPHPEFACDSHDRVAHAGVEEICDGIDNDCNGQIDSRSCETICGYGGQVCDEFGVWGECNTPVLNDAGLCEGMS